MNVLVVYCHPRPDSFVGAVRDAAVEGLSASGKHTVRVRDLYADGFEPRMSADERRAHSEPDAGSNVGEYATELRWCEHLVLVYPTWWSGLPAMLKGWVDRVWVRGVAWEAADGLTRITGRLNNIRRISIVTTHGSSKHVNMLEGEAGKRLIRRTLRGLCHPLCRSRWVAMYGVDTADAGQRQAFLDRVRRTLS